MVIVGDVKHSRVARSDVDLLGRLGARITLVGPATLMPDDVGSWGIGLTDDLDSAVSRADVLYMLRVQRERMESGLLPPGGEYSARFGLDARRAALLSRDAIVMHPGPMNRGVEMLVDPADLAGSRILAQVENGVSVRMAVLFHLMGDGGEAG